VAGDPAGLADVYDRYGPALYGYCRTLLRGPQDGADAVQDTFVITAARVSALRDRTRLRPWLYAVARNECHRKLRSREVAAEVDTAESGFGGEAMTAEVGLTAQQAELRELVHAAISELNPADREVIELNFRQHLDGGDLAAVLGVSRNQAQAIASRADGQLDKALGAQLVARTGRRFCDELDDILADRAVRDGDLDAPLRKRVNRHIDNCDICGERKRRALRPALLYGLAPLPALPPRLRHQVMALCSDDSPDAMEFKRDVAREAGRFDPDGFPLPLVRIGRRRFGEPSSALVAAAAVAAAAFVIIAMIALRGSPALHTLDDNKNSGGPGSAAVTSAAVASPTASSLVSTAPQNTMPPSTSAAIVPTAPPVSSSSPSPKPKKSSTKAPPSSPSASPSPSPSPSATRSLPPSPSASPTPSPSPSPQPSPTSTQPTPSPTPSSSS
jgi:RNA polymerase sigma factor (sigma-70 family)